MAGISAAKETVASPVGLRRIMRLKKAPIILRLAQIVLVVLLVAAVLAPWISPYDMSSQRLLARLKPPIFLGGTSDHILGTDHLGRDLLSRLLFGLRTTLLLSAAGVVLGALAGGVAGLAAGLLRGWVERIVVVCVDAHASIPSTLFALTAIAIAGSNPLVLAFVIGLCDFDKYARVARSETLAILGKPFLDAAIAVGIPRHRIVTHYVIRNALSALIVIATINFSTIVILESSLSFLGIGVQPPAASLGQMVGEARDYLISDWRLAAIPAVLIVMITIAVALVGDALRDFFDPHLRGN
ncbi:ABC transporter permease [Sinorhizobium meliloti]|uniref:ABC transporter permease n=1 Tax=Rhizobium meliloti TaxID=382 RepID=UPI000FDCB458|nr:ABC transporter permease [Sinorhizobium meliloti]RVM17880.1 ABC transporter permease [Sinorhizobium meliloti]RVO34210.1 ABC transporter permease [Sinorhizobium meliloti]